MRHGGLARVFVGHEGILADPYFLRVIPGKLDIDLVRQLDGAHVFAHLPLACGDVFRAVAVPVELLELPDEAVVVAVGDADRIEDAQTRHIAARGEDVIQLHAEVP